MEESMLARQHDALKEWVTNVDSELQNVSRPVKDVLWHKRSIYRIPKGFGDPSRRKAYMPKVVSFGPYHHGEPNLKPMEEHKHRVLIHFLGRANKRVGNCVDAMEGVVQQLMDSYDQLKEEWRDRGRFLKLMILDGCFVIETLRNVDKIETDYAEHDPIFSQHGRICKMPHIKRDMLMIENQIPILVLEKLIAVESNNSPDEESANKLVFEFFTSNSLNYKMGQRLHVLDVVRSSMLRDTPTNRKSPHRSTEVIWPATELREAGIRFKCNKSQCLKDIKFEKGILTLPQIIVDDATESKFLNLMAFEQLHVNAGTGVSSYVSFMDHIIDSERDLILLNKRKIIKNFLGTDQAVANLFNGISQDVSFDPGSSLGEVHKNVTAYCNKKWYRWRANLTHTYFRSPWALLSLLAAIFLLGVTVAQFVYGLIDFYHQEG